MDRLPVGEVDDEGGDPVASGGDPGVTAAAHVRDLATGAVTGPGDNDDLAGDLGAKGGLVTDADTRVLRADGSAIVGLYAYGNNSASVMGRTYPGPGSTLDPAVVFGYRAAQHIAASTS